jgi:uncharacterized membrane protein YheB (UPF0754 family)
MWTNIIIMTVVGGLIGYTTNVVAVKMLFRPLKAFRVPIIGWEIQGLIPKRQSEIAKSIGQTVQEELISVEEIIDKLVEDMDKTAMIEMAKARILTLAEQNMPPMVPSMFKGPILKYVADAVDQNAESVMNELSEKIVHQATEKIQIAEMVAEKIEAFDVMRLEEIIFAISKQELKHIEVLGGVLGVLIGLIQGIVVTLL